MTTPAGEYEGDTCNLEGCSGILGYPPVQGCSCHLSPPCSACTDNPLTCPECGWQEDRRFIMNDHVLSENKTTGIWRDHGLRPLDPTRIDWHSFSHSHCSMIKEGVYPEGTTSKQVQEVVDGTFGGKFESFGNGKFKFIAYTD